MSSAAALPERSWVDGEEATTVAAVDRGLQYGDGLFETMAGVGGGVRFLSLHLKRLAQWLRALSACTAPEAAAAASRDRPRRRPRGSTSVIGEADPHPRDAHARGYAVTGHEHPTRILLRYARAPAESLPAEGGVHVRLADLRLAENPALAGMKHLKSASSRYWRAWSGMIRTLPRRSCCRWAAA